MRTLFRHTKLIQRELEQVQTSLKVLRKKPQQVHNGKKEPKNTLGKNGDLYVLSNDTDPKVIYLKENGKWV